MENLTKWVNTNGKNFRNKLKGDIKTNFSRKKLFTFDSVK